MNLYQHLICKHKVPEEFEHGPYKDYDWPQGGFKTQANPSDYFSLISATPAFLPKTEPEVVVHVLKWVAKMQTDIEDMVVASNILKGVM